MLLKFNQKNKLWIPNFGIYSPGEIIKIENELIANKMLDTGYFEKVEEKKVKNIKKGDDK